jgi:hypothetical protein
MENYFKAFSFEHISKNIKAGELAKGATRKTTLPLDVFIQTIEDSSLKTIIQGEFW